MAEAHNDDAENRIDTETFVEWCEQQAEQSMCLTARIIANGEHEGRQIVRFRIRESVRDDPEDITLIKGKGTDTLRFKCGDDTRQFHLHRRNVTLHEKTLIVRAKDGEEICRAGVGTKNKRGAFPV